MIRILIRELFLTALLFVVVSLLGFAVLDRTGIHDWWSSMPYAARAGIPAEHALARDLPGLWNRSVRDAGLRTLEDIRELESDKTGDTAIARLLHRGTAALPTMLSHLDDQPLVASRQQRLLRVLAAMAPAITGGEQPPTETVAAIEWWQRFKNLRGLDFRRPYARRMVQRWMEHGSANAREQLRRLGTFALPAVFELLGDPLDQNAAIRLTGLLCDLTGKELRILPSDTHEQSAMVLRTWQVWWFAERLEYETFSEIDRLLGHFLETRYGRWVSAILSDNLGTSVVTARPVIVELKERLPVSVMVTGLGGLLATALVVAFGGGSAFRSRSWKAKLLDLLAALLPGLVAFILGFVALFQLCASALPPDRLGSVMRDASFRIVIAVLSLTLLAVLALQRASVRAVFDQVRLEAESWIAESRDPKAGQMLRHGTRVGLASLLAPLGVSALTMFVLSYIVEPLTGVRGMGELTFRAIRRSDAPWLLVAALTVVPVVMGRRWARQILSWALVHEDSDAPTKPTETNVQEIASKTDTVEAPPTTVTQPPAEGAETALPAQAAAVDTVNTGSLDDHAPKVSTGNPSSLAATTDPSPKA